MSTTNENLTIVFRSHTDRFNAMFGFEESPLGSHEDVWWHGTPGGTSHGTTIRSLGDEIGVERTGTDVQFVQWLQKKSVAPAEVGCPLATWPAVLAQCNHTSGVCPQCGSCGHIANATDLPSRRLIVYSTSWYYELGLQYYQNLTIHTANGTDILVGANFSPIEFFTDTREHAQHGGDYRQLYMPDPNQWISFLRHNGTTLPWGEDKHG
jgi:hypothetical protein